MRLFTSELVKKYKARTVVNHVSIDVNQGEIVGLLGPNGAGKTTTFYMIVGLIKPNEGKIFLEDNEGRVAELTDEPVYRRAQMGVGYLAQEASVFRRLSVEDNIRAVLEMTRFSKEYQAERVEALIKEFRLEKVRKSMGIQLSGGERRRHAQKQEYRRHHHRPQRRRDARNHRPRLPALRGQGAQNGFAGGAGRRPRSAQTLSGQALRTAPQPDDRPPAAAGCRSAALRFGNRRGSYARVARHAAARIHTTTE